MILVLQKSPEGVPKICKMLLLVLYERKARCTLNEEGQAATAVKEPFKPYLKVPESSDDRMCDGMSKYENHAGTPKHH